MKTKSKTSSKKYLMTLQKLKFEIIQRRAAVKILIKSERRYKQLLKESYRMQEQLRLLSRQVLFAHEEERKKISRELHDEIGQILTGVNVRLAALKNESTDNTKSIKRKITTTQRLVEKSMKTIHRFARELRPAVLDDMGLIPALHSHIKDFAAHTHIPVRFKIFTFDKIKEMNSAQRTAFYRVAQEALCNVAKHAEASLVKMSLQKRDGVVRMEIKDDGKSFSVERVLRTRKRKRLGLLGMRERMEMIGGSLTIESSPGNGTTILAQAPLTIHNGANRNHAHGGFL